MSTKVIWDDKELKKGGILHFDIDFKIVEIGADGRVWLEKGKFGISSGGYNYWQPNLGFAEPDKYIPPPRKPLTVGEECFIDHDLPATTHSGRVVAEAGDWLWVMPDNGQRAPLTVSRACAWRKGDRPSDP